MKKMLCLLSLLLCLCCAFALAETAQVSTLEELVSALENGNFSDIEVVSDLTVTRHVTLTKNTVINADVLIQPLPDETFFVKSLEAPSGVTLTINGRVTTDNTFTDQGFAIGQLYVNGGTIDLSNGSVSSECNICFNGGTIIPPASGFGSGVRIARYIYEGYNNMQITEQVKAAFNEPLLRSIVLQIEYAPEESLTVPSGKSFLIYETWLTLENGISITGSVNGESTALGGGIILLPGSSLNDMTVPEGASFVQLTWNTETNSFDIETVYPNRLTDDLTWSLSPDGKLTISGEGAIPNLTQVPWAEDADSIVQFNLSEGITALGTGLFAGSGAESVWLPASLLTIADHALDGLGDDLTVFFFQQDSNNTRDYLHARRINWAECVGYYVTFRDYKEDGWQDQFIEDGQYAGWTNYDNEGRILSSWYHGVSTEYGYDDGVLARVFMFNEDGERTYMAFYNPGESQPWFVVAYTAYHYNDDGTWSVDYEARIGSESRVGTDYMQGQGEDQRILASEYTRNGSERIRCDYDEQENYLQRIWDADGSPLSIGIYGADYSCIREWDLTDENVTLQTKGNEYAITTVDEDGALREYIRGASFVGWERYDSNDEMVESEFDGIRAEYFPVGDMKGIFKYNADGEQIYKAFITSTGVKVMEINYTAYHYGPEGRDGDWHVDFTATIGGEYRVGTDYMHGWGENMVILANDYRLNNGHRVHCDYNIDESYIQKEYDENGDLILVGAYSASYDLLHEWDLTDGRFFELPADTLTVETGAFTGVDADKLRLPSGVETIEAGAIDSGTLVFVPKGSAIITRLRILELYVIEE